MLVAETKLIDAFLTTVENTLKMKQTACSHFKFKDILSWYKLLALFLVLLRENGGHELYEEDNPGPGHLEPLGSQRPTEGKIDTLDDFPDPQEFYDKYILPGKPVLIKNGARHIPAFTLWNDAYLSEKYGKEPVLVEIGKKETRKGEPLNVRLKTFLKIYNHSDIYMVQDAFDSMKGDLTLPRSLQCGGFQDQILKAVLWFSSGGTKSVLHNDLPDNVNCILDGNKDIIFIDKNYAGEVQANGWEPKGGYSKMDVTSVDLNAFPQFKSIPWWSGTMLKGDCLFIPHRWYHAVTSSNTRNLAANLWFNHLMWFNKTDCQLNPAKESDISLKNVTLLGLESIEMIRQDLFADLEGRKEIYREDVVDTWDGLLSLEEIQQVFGLADADHDMVLSCEEIYKLDMLMIAQNFPQLIGFPEDGFSDGAHDEL